MYSISSTDRVVRKTEIDIIASIRYAIDCGISPENIKTILSDLSFDIDDMKKSYDNTDVHSHWSISSDGYYPYCANCGYEPSWSSLKELWKIKNNQGSLPDRCSSCFAHMDDF